MLIYITSDTEIKFNNIYYLIALAILQTHISYNHDTMIKTQFHDAQSKFHRNDY